MSYGMDYQGGDNYGGGFSTDAYGARSSQGDTQGTGGYAKRNYDEQTLIPVTARMILAAQARMEGGDQLHLEDDRKLHRIKLVGAIRAMERNSTNIHYSIEDGTGLVEVKQWVDETACTAALEMIHALENAEHCYVKVFGKIKAYDNKFTVMADCIRPLSTGNELTHHFLEVVYSGEKHKNKSTIVPPKNVSPDISSFRGGIGFAGSAGSGHRTSLVAQGGGGGRGGDPVRDAVIQFIQQHGETNEYGANIGQCISSHPHLNQDDIRRAVDGLQAEGMIYSTVNEDYFKCAM